MRQRIPCDAKLEGGKRCGQPAVVVEDGQNYCPKHSRHAKAKRAFERGKPVAGKA